MLLLASSLYESLSGSPECLVIAMLLIAIEHTYDTQEFWDTGGRGCSDNCGSGTHALHLGGRDTRPHITPVPCSGHMTPGDPGYAMHMGRHPVAGS